MAQGKGKALITLRREKCAHGSLDVNVGHRLFLPGKQSERFETSARMDVTRHFSLKARTRSSVSVTKN